MENHIPQVCPICHVLASAKPGHALAKEKTAFSSGGFEGSRLDFWVSDDLAFYTQNMTYVNGTSKYVNSVTAESSTTETSKKKGNESKRDAAAAVGTARLQP